MRLSLGKEKAAGKLSCKEGKDELPEKMFRKFAEMWLSKKPYKPGVFAFLYGSLSWMLMARTTNVQKLGYSHISVEGDCLGFRFMITKTDPNGEKYTGKKHVYANAVDPSGCSILAMAVYWMLNPHNDGNFVFTGSNPGYEFERGSARSNEQRQGRGGGWSQGVEENERERARREPLETQQGGF